MRTLKEEEVYLNECETYEDALKQAAKSIDAVSHKNRIHSALSNLNPAQFEAEWWAQQGAKKYPLSELYSRANERVKFKLRQQRSRDRLTRMARSSGGEMA